MANILIISEENVDLKFLEITLSKQGHKVDIGNDFAIPTEKIKTILPEIIIINVEQNETDGFDLCKEIRKNKLFHHIPVLLYCDTKDGDMTITGFECGATDYISKPVNQEEVSTRINLQIERINAHKKAQDKNEEFTKEMKETLEKIFHPQMETILALANLAQSRDDETGKHLERMQKYTYVLTKELQKKEKYKNIIDDKFLAEISAAAPLHDLGKIGIPDKILLKPGKLTKEEYEVIKTHTLIGDETLDNVEKTFGENSFITMGKIIARSHHERVDGKGYPDNLSGEDIPIAASIMAIADIYDALRTRKIYKPAISHEKTIEYFKEQKGTQFVPEVVDAFLNVEKIFSYIWLEYETMLPSN